MEKYSKIFICIISARWPVRLCQNIENVEKALISVGRVANLEDLWDDKVGINITKRGIENDDTQTNVPNIYAVGDLTADISLVNVGELEGRYAVEVRNAEFLTPAYFAVLREHDVAHVFNSWTRMPSIGMQLDLPGSIPASFIVARVLLRPGRYYAAAVDAFAPYSDIKDPNPELRNDIVRLVRTAENLRIPAYILVNNRAEGSAPKTIAAVAAMLAARG